MGFEICTKIFEGNETAIADCLASQPFVGSFFGGFMGIMVAFGILLMLGLMAAVYVYHALAWMTIARKLKHKYPWLAWIPLASTAMRLQLGKFRWEWIFLVFIPFFGWIALWVMTIIVHWRIFEKRKYPGWFSLAVIIPQIGWLFYMIIIGFVAWEDRKKMLFK